MTVKTIARKIGLNPSSNGQLMKTALEAGCLAVRWFATRELGLRPQRVAKGLSSGGPPPPVYRKNLDPPIDDRALGLRRGALRIRSFHRLGHGTQYETSGSPAQAPVTGSKSQNRSGEVARQAANLPGNSADKGQPKFERVPWASPGTRGHAPPAVRSPPRGP